MVSQLGPIGAAVDARLKDMESEDRRLLLLTLRAAAVDLYRKLTVRGLGGKGYKGGGKVWKRRVLAGWGGGMRTGNRNLALQVPVLFGAAANIQHRHQHAPAPPWLDVDYVLS